MSRITFLFLATTSLFSLISCDTASTQASLHDNSQNCTCYTLDSDNTAAFFLYHKFYDFRNLPATNTEPPLVSANQRYGQEETQDQDVLNSSSWNNDWEIQTWGKKVSGDAPVAMQNSPLNVFVGLSSSLSLLYRDSLIQKSRTPTSLNSTRQHILHPKSQIPPQPPNNPPSHLSIDL